MDNLKEYTKNPLYTFIAGIIIGLIIGLPILGWGLLPVQWTDASPVDLVQSEKLDYLRMAVDSYTKTRDAHQAQLRWNALGEEKDALLTAIQNDPKLLQQEVADFAMTVKGAASAAELAPGSTVPTNPVNPAQPVAASTEAESQPEKADAGMNPILPLLLFLLLAALVIGAVVYFVVFKKKTFATEPILENIQKVFKPKEAEPMTPLANAVTKSASPIAQFLTTYTLGDDMYDDSFSIDSPLGEFLGECGVGISETMGVGDPKKVSAFELWLFDKNDIQTITKVLMSEFAFNDPATHQRLMAKGEPVLLEPEKQVLLDTATLQLEARVVDVTYGTNGMPDRSFVERMTLELAVWPKE